ncbi:DsbA family protein [Streptomyces sp. NPDC052396]|uniref:DsbA family protein n=1 Tax=Streptomyces sp. NPDC052396 TaxID=3365689 RepID=UPI0037D894B3
MEEPRPGRTVHTEVVLDVICAHSYLGWTRFQRAAGRLRAVGVRVGVTVAPFELAPGAGTEGRPLLEVLREVFGPEAAAGTAQFARHAAADGLRLDYQRAVATGTFKAHLLIALAARQDRAEAMVERLFRAHFTDGLHIGDDAVLAALAAEVGVVPGELDERELRARLDAVRAAGVTGVPVFRIGGRVTLTGSQPEAVLYAALKDAADAASAV